jgi:hypothetical protein
VRLICGTYPERTTSLVMYGAYARGLPEGDYHWAATKWTTTRDELQARIDAFVENWGEPTELLGIWGPSIAEDEHRRRWWSRYLRMSASPAAAVALARMNHEVDIRPVLPTIRVPTLIIHRAHDSLICAEGSRYMADRIPGAKYVELPGAKHLWFFGDQDALVDETEEFLTGTRQAPEHDRVLATVMFTDIVGSSERVAKLGDWRCWRELLASHESVVRTELERFRGREVKTLGRGLDYARFRGRLRRRVGSDRHYHGSSRGSARRLNSATLA